MSTIERDLSSSRQSYWCFPPTSAIWRLHLTGQGNDDVDSNVPQSQVKI